jgi:hypothetical protein
MSPNARRRRSRCIKVNVQRVVPQKVYSDWLGKAGNRDFISGSELSKKLVSITNGLGQLIWRRHFGAPKTLAL